MPTAVSPRGNANAVGPATAFALYPPHFEQIALGLSGGAKQFAQIMPSPRNAARWHSPPMDAMRLHDIGIMTLTAQSSQGFSGASYRACILFKPKLGIGIEHHPFFRDAKATIWERISSGFAPSAPDVAMRRIISACL